MILEDKVKIPLGPRNYKAKQGGKFSIGYDENNKDGFYISRDAEQKFWNYQDFKFKK